MIANSSSIPRCVAVDNGSLLAASPHHSQPMSIGSLVAPGVHPDLANDCSLVWNGMDLPLQQPRPSPHMFQGPVPESADDSPFYSSPAETCPSPLSDATFSLPPHSSSSISSASVSVIDQYPKGLFKTETSSPLQMASPLRWDGSEQGMPPSHFPISIEEHLIQPVCLPLQLKNNIEPPLIPFQPVQCHYPSPSWSSGDYLPYEDHAQPLAHINPMGWKQWAM